MAKYFARSCPRCNGYVEIIMREPERYMPLKAVNGRCVRCAYHLAWIVIRGGRNFKPRDSSRKKASYVGEATIGS